MIDFSRRVTRFARRLVGQGTTDLSKLLIAQGAIASRHLMSIQTVKAMSDVEFSIFSQWGEDGIIEWLIQQNGEMPETFVEFGIENYRESNTRFLISNRNWRGLVIDGSAENIEALKSDSISWQRDLIAKCAFVTADNIEKIITDAGFDGDIGLLSIDIDGNDYWVWKVIDRIKPHFVVVEYNAVFGDVFDLTIPYDPLFVRSKAHYSNLYYGASIGAFMRLGLEKGYALLGSNRVGSNAFFVRDDRASLFHDKIVDRGARPSRFRESRDQAGVLTHSRGLERAKVIGECQVVETSTGRRDRLTAFGELYSARWLSAIE